jgi:hypothetical protein
VTLQDPVTREQVVELKLPEPEDEKVTVPVGVPEGLVTVAVHFVPLPTRSGFTHETVVVVVYRRT